MYRNFLILIISLLFGLVLAVKPTFAAECTIIYGGGEIDCSKITPIPSSNQTQSKGGLTVQKATNATKTPATGPEALGLVSLIPMAAAGFWLRKKK